jgi:predicted PurR-regulated permease PerM
MTSRAVRSPQAEIVYAAVGLLFSAIAWWLNPWFIPSLIGVVLAIRAIVISRRMVDNARRTVLILGIIGLIVGVLALIGTVLALVIRVGS